MDKLEYPYRITKEELKELAAQVPIPCLVTAITKDEVTLVAYDFIQPTGEAILISQKVTNSAKLSCFAIGQCVHYRKLSNGDSSYYSATPLDGWNIQRLEAARREFLPQVYGD